MLELDLMYSDVCLLLVFYSSEPKILSDSILSHHCNQIQLTNKSKSKSVEMKLDRSKCDY